MLISVLPVAIYPGLNGDPSTASNIVSAGINLGALSRCISSVVDVALNNKSYLSFTIV